MPFIEEETETQEHKGLNHRAAGLGLQLDAAQWLSPLYQDGHQTVVLLQPQETVPFSDRCPLPQQDWQWVV